MYTPVHAGVHVPRYENWGTRVGRSDLLWGSGDQLRSLVVSCQLMALPRFLCAQVLQPEKDKCSNCRTTLRIALETRALNGQTAPNPSAVLAWDSSSPAHGSAPGRAAATGAPKRRASAPLCAPPSTFSDANPTWGAWGLVGKASLGIPRG